MINNGDIYDVAFFARQVPILGLICDFSRVVMGCDTTYPQGRVKRYKWRGQIVTS